MIPYRIEAKGDDIDEMIYEKALAFCQFEFIKPTDYDNTRNGCWTIYANRDVFSSASYDQEPYPEKKEKFKDLKFVIKYVYDSLYKSKEEEWNKITSEAISFGLLDESEAKECPHITVDDEKDLALLAKYYDLIESKKLIYDSKHERLWLERHSSLQGPSLRHLLESVIRQGKENFKLEKDKVFNSAVELGIIKSKALIKTSDSMLLKERIFTHPLVIGISMSIMLLILFFSLF